MKKLVSILLAGSILAAICPCVGFAAEGSEVTTTTDTFTYTENFDTPSAGVPTGWTLYSIALKKQDGVTDNTKVSVEDGALTFTNTNWYGGEWLLFDALDEVLRYDKARSKQLTMECDITYVANTTTNYKDESAAGFAYAVNVIDPSVTDNIVTGKSDDTNTLEGNYVALYTDKTDTTNQMIRLGSSKNAKDTSTKAFEDRSNIAAVPQTPAINSDGGKTMHLQIICNNITQEPIVIIDGVQVNTDRDYSDRYITSGKIGFYIRNASVKLDNLTVSGTGTYPDDKSYKAAFKKASKSYVTESDAKNDVVVSEYNYFGNYIGVATNKATIESVDNNDGTGTVTVTYGSYTEDLIFNFKSKESGGFVYEENFDNINDGTSLADWKLYTADAQKTTCNVSNGALNFSSTSEYGSHWLLFNVDSVARDGLTMECDITHVQNVTNGNRGNSRVGLAYAANIDAEGNVTGSYASIRTDVNNPDTQLGYMFEPGVDLGKWTFTANAENTAGGTAIDAINKTADTTMRLKIYFNDPNQAPIVYLNDKQVTYERRTLSNTTQYAQVGLYLCNANVRIDNVKITGTEYEYAPDDNSIAISALSYDSANATLRVTADAKLVSATTSAKSAVIIAVYDSSDRFLLSKTVKIDTSKVVDYHGTIAINGVSSEPEAGKVKLFFWNLDGMNRFVLHKDNSSP